MTLSALLITAISMGLMSSLHCVGMCSGLMVALCQPSKQQQQQHLLALQLGRICTYGILGFSTAYLSGAFSLLGSLMGADQSNILRILIGISLLFFGTYLLGFKQLSNSLETQGQKIWSWVRPLQRKLMPIDSITKAYAFGLLWAFIPCGLLYAMLFFSLSAYSPVDSMLTMLAYGLGTLPATYFSSHYLLKKSQKIPLAIAGALYSALGLITLVFSIFPPHIFPKSMTDLLPSFCRPLLGL